MKPLSKIAPPCKKCKHYGVINFNVDCNVCEANDYYKFRGRVGENDVR